MCKTAVKEFESTMSVRYCCYIRDSNIISMRHPKCDQQMLQQMSYANS